MAVSIRHVLEQRAMLRTLGGALTSSLRSSGKAKPCIVPGPWISASISPPSDTLIRAFVKNVGGDPSLYRGLVPPHLFSQWAIPVAFEAIAAGSSSSGAYSLTRVINAGCKLEQKAPLPLGKRLQVKARLESVDDDGKRAILSTKIVTGSTSSIPDALVAEIHAFVPLAPRKKEQKERKAPAIVPHHGAREIAFVRLGADAGLDFAKLTGDFNPIHWVPAYARASGFRSTILHGFGTFALAFEAVVRRMLSGNVRALASMEARFTKPLTLPNSVGVYVTEKKELFVGNGAGAPAYLTGEIAQNHE